jgi:hypothetical protein
MLRKSKNIFLVFAITGTVIGCYSQIPEYHAIYRKYTPIEENYNPSLKQQQKDKSLDRRLNDIDDQVNRLRDVIIKKENENDRSK